MNQQARDAVESHGGQSPNLTRSLPTHPGCSLAAGVLNVFGVSGVLTEIE